ncbi:uncharacterized protein LOC113010752 [Astatotilapia calliptera]|uniref:uncharacterized protein LOC113010752 n=1 Tax=Astatotilapia calliptera TaxID=8154 RepID=UPI000E424B60|nr:uncharacterized protein LOC113010752 [Astatotilapia calliptera]
MKVFDQSDTEVDAEVFEEIVKGSPVTFRVMLSNEELGVSLSSSSSPSDDTIILNFTMCEPPEEAATTEGRQPKRPCHINYEAKALIEKILTTKPGGEHIIQEYAKTKSLTDATRRQMINILAAEMTEAHGHSADEDTIREKMKATFIYRHSMVSDDKNAADVFIVFPRFLDTPGLIEQDFRLLFDEVTANKFLERWPIDLKSKIVKESHGLVPTSELLELMCNAELGQ